MVREWASIGFAVAGVALFLVAIRDLSTKPQQNLPIRFHLCLIYGAAFLGFGVGLVV